MKYICDITELKKCMIENGIDTITELSTLSRISRNTLGKLFNGKEQPSSIVMYKLVDVLNLSPERAGRIFFKTNLRKT